MNDTATKPAKAEDHTADWAPHVVDDDDHGAEVVDLGDDGKVAEEASISARDRAPKPADLDDAPPAALSDGAPYAGDRAMWPDYEWAGWLARVLRRAGVKVIEYPGWQTRGRPRSVGSFRPRGVMWHHDASARGSSPGLASFIAVTGRPAEGIPAPLSQVWVCAGCAKAHEVGTWHVLAAGRANHAGEGGGWGAIGEDAGATYTIGIETDNTTGEKTPAKMYDSLVLGTAAILNHLRSRPGDWLTAHKEYAKGRKIDPDDINMSDARGDVRRAMRRLEEHQGDDDGPDRPLVEFPGRDAFRIGKPHDAVEQLRRWLLKLPAGENLQPKVKHPRLFTAGMRTAVRTFQERHDALAGDADGIPGPKTWEMVQRAARRDS